MARLERKGIMLAHPLTDNKLATFFPRCIGQPKLNGERCRVEWFEDKPILFSSFGNEFAFKEVIKAALQGMPKLRYDGELYVHGWTRDKIASVANRKVNRHPEDDQLQFHVFDLQEDEYQVYRLMQLEDITWNNAVHKVATFIVTPQVISAYTQEMLNQGYEGIILRHPAGLYEMKRSNWLLKHKPTKVDYYWVVGVKEAVSEDGEPKGMIGSFEVMGKERMLFSVGAGKLTHPERKEIWEKGLWKDKWLKVKHEHIKTSGDVPVSCVAVSLVDMIGE
jgi:ATP-dependent DNA ligase